MFFEELTLSPLINLKYNYLSNFVIFFKLIRITYFCYLEPNIVQKRRRKSKEKKWLSSYCNFGMKGWNATKNSSRKQVKQRTSIRVRVSFKRRTIIRLELLHEATYRQWIIILILGKTHKAKYVSIIFSANHC